MKSAALLNLTRNRQSCRLDSYGCIGELQDGLFECDHVSFWTKSGGNTAAKVMVVGQDWSSGDVLNESSPDLDSARLGFSPRFPTKANLDSLLDFCFELKRTDCYLASAFVFIRLGRLSANIPLNDLAWSVR